MPSKGRDVRARAARTLSGLSMRSPTAPPRSAESASAAMCSGASSGPPGSAWHDTITPWRIAVRTASYASVSATDGSGHDALDDRLLEHRVEEQRRAHRD